MIDPTEILAILKRPDGSIKVVRIPSEHLGRLVELANGEFGDKSIELGGPALPKEGK